MATGGPDTGGPDEERSEVEFALSSAITLAAKIMQNNKSRSKRKPPGINTSWPPGAEHSKVNKKWISGGQRVRVFCCTNAWCCERRCCDRRWWVYASTNKRLARARMFPRPQADVIMKQTAPALAHSSVAQWQSIRLLTGGL